MPIVTGSQVVLAGLSINDLNLGYNPVRIPTVGQTTGDAFVEGRGSSPFARGGKQRSLPLRVWLAAPSAIGGQPAGSQAANEFLAQQLEEFAGNPDLQPCYIKLSGVRGLPHDGWWVIDSCKPDYTYTASGRIPVDMTLIYKGPGTLRRLMSTMIGGALPSGYAGTALPWLAFPLNAVIPTTTVTRTGSEGAIPVVVNPSLNPVPWVMSSTLQDTFKGGCHVYDSIVAGANPVPTDGTALNGNWVEVYGIDHAFAGDLIVSNGLQLLRFQGGAASQVCTVWHWNTALGPPAWQQYGTVQYLDSSGGNQGTLRQVSLLRLGPEEVSLQAVGFTSAGQVGLDLIRVQRGARLPRIEFKPQSQTSTSTGALTLSLVTGAKIIANSVAVNDSAVTPSASLTPSGDYGYAVAVIANSSYPFLAGMVWQNPPNNGQPTSGSATTLGSGDSAGPGQYLGRLYGVFAVPFPTPQNLQAEAESGTLGAPWASAADGAASGGNAAKLPSGTATNKTNFFGTAGQPPAGSYRCWFRVRSGTSGAGATGELFISLWNATDSSNVQVLNLAPNVVTTGYLWYATGASPVTVPAGKNLQFLASSSATTTVDWYVDEAFLEPITNGSDFPQDLAAQFLYDRRVERQFA